MTSPTPQEIEDFHNLEEVVHSHGISFINAGACVRMDALKLVPELLQRTKYTSVSYTCAETFDFPEALEVADTILEISRTTNGKGNFRFCTTAYSEGSPTPFFPAAHASAATDNSFAIGLENGALLHDVLTRPECKGSLQAIEHLLRDSLESALLPVCAVAKEVGASHGLRFAGFDTSIAPGLADPSIADSFAAVLGAPYRFGASGTLSLCAHVTKAVKAVNVGAPVVGYSGIMLPVQEDAGLVLHADANHYSISELLMTSAVCGVGIDTVPCPGPTGHPKEDGKLKHAIARVILDVATMAHRLKKPLSCRLLPVPGKRVGDRTDFNNPYLIEANIMSLE